MKSKKKNILWSCHCFRTTSKRCLTSGRASTMRFGQRWHFSFYIKIVKQIHFNKYFPKKTWLWSNFFWGDCAGEKLHFNKYFQKTLDFNQISFQVIVLERNRRVAKAYARAPVVTVNGSEEGFDGFRIGKKEEDHEFAELLIKNYPWIELIGKPWSL